jgi:spermidine synthase
VRSSVWRTRAILACFFLSGATSLAEEVLWVRQLSLIFGSTNYAVSTVIAVFMAGLALGAWWVGRRADGWREPLKAYGYLELGIGVYALAVPLLFMALVPIYRFCWGVVDGNFAAMSLVRAICSALVLLPPTTMMGATLPLLVRHCTDQPRAIGGSTGRLYAANTFGAVLGCLGGGLILLPWFGETGTLWTAGCTDLAVGAVVLGLLVRGVPAFDVRGGEIANANANAIVNDSEPAPEKAPAPGADAEAAAEAAPPLAPALEPAADPRRALRLGAIAFGCAGAAGLIQEVAWTRLLAMVLGGSVYSFTIILGCFLMAIAAGSAIGTRFILPRVRNDLGAFANCQAYAALAGVFGCYLYERLPFAFVHLSVVDWIPTGLVWGVVGAAVGLSLAVTALPSLPIPAERRSLMGIIVVAGLAAGGVLLAWLTVAPTAKPDLTHSSDVAAMFLLGALVVVPPTLLSGCGFPLLIRGLAPALSKVGSRVGALYAANTIGAICGSLVGGFLLVRWLGLQQTILAGTAVAAVAAAVAAWATRGTPGTAHARRNALVVACFALLLPRVMPPSWDPGLVSSGPYLYGNTADWPTFDAYLSEAGSAAVGGRVHHVLDYEEGLTATVAVYRSDTGLFLRVNGKTDASSVGDMSTQTLVGQLPMLFAPRTDRVLVIGVGSGISVDAVSHHRPTRLAAVELEGAVVRATRFFEGINGALYDRAARGELELIAEDARNYLLATGEQWDVVVSEPSNPWQTGSAKVFTREFFATVRQRLAPGGVFAQWLQMYSLDLTAASSVLRTVRAEFAHVYVFAPMPQGDLLILASAEPLPLDFARAAGRIAASPACAAQLARSYIERPEQLLGYVLADGEAVDAFIAAHPAPVNDDDGAFIEYHAPKALRIGSSGALIDRALTEAAGATWTRIADRAPDPAALLVESARSLLARTTEPFRGAKLRPSLAKRAVAFCDAAIARRPSADAYFVRGQARLRLDFKQEPEAFEDWTTALKLDPAHVPALTRLARYYFDDRFFGEAIPFAQRAVAAAPKDFEARLILAKSLARDGRTAEAEPILAGLAAEDEAGHYPGAHLYLGLAAMGSNRTVAETALRRYLQMRPNEPAARRDLARVLRRLGRDREADRQERYLDERHEAAKLAEGALWASHWAPMRQTELEQTTLLRQAEERWRGALEKYPFVIDYHMGYFRLLRQRARFEDCITVLREARRLFPRSGWTANNLAFMLELQVRLGRAEPSTLTEGAAALRAAAPYALQRFAPGDLRNRAARLEYWAAHGRPKHGLSGR